MKMPTLAVALVALTFGAAHSQSPYAGMQARPIKALSSEQIADLKAGRGMGLALTAELNGYPGPAHLLELADKLIQSLDVLFNQVIEDRSGFASIGDGKEIGPPLLRVPLELVKLVLAGNQRGRLKCE